MRTRGKMLARGYAVREAIMTLKCTTSLTMPEIAKEIGRSTGYCRQVWSVLVREAEHMRTDPEKKKDLQAWMIAQVQMTITKAQNRIDDHAAYGALVLKGVEQLGVMLGLDKEVMNDKYSTQEIAARLDARSPLVLAKLGRVSDFESADKVAEDLN